MVAHWGCSGQLRDIGGCGLRGLLGGGGGLWTCTSLDPHLFVPAFFVDVM